MANNDGDGDELRQQHLSFSRNALFVSNWHKIFIRLALFVVESAS